ncbi:hypothetical protein [Vibrio cholerae]|uniref:hypothetical protein n=1 Tax=Vibrio cholerae TaxID=666 RepID=UPI0016482764|nr:hypothetical protein [Vibrio cholerae]
MPIAEFEGWELSQLEITTIITELGVIVVVTALSIIATNFVDRELKFKLTFFSNKKPAFHSRKYALSDSRLDINQLEKKWPEIFLKDADKDRIEREWYSKVYLPVRDSIVVTSANKQFLIARDCYIGWLFITSIILTLDLNHIYDFSDYALQLSLIFIVILNLASRATGKNLVLNSICEAINVNHKSVQAQ